MRVHLPAPAFHIGTEPAVIVKIGTAAAVILGTGSPVLFPGGAGLVTAFMILGTAALTGKHGQALLSIQAPAASSGKAAASAMGVLVPPSAGRNCLPLFRYGFIIPARLCGDSSPV